MLQAYKTYMVLLIKSKFITHFHVESLITFSYIKKIVIY
jgi:hypothetical protein